jgi:hypothetical protein
MRIFVFHIRIDRVHGACYSREFLYALSLKNRGEPRKSEEIYACLSRQSSRCIIYTIFFIHLASGIGIVDSTFLTFRFTHTQKDKQFENLNINYQIIYYWI